MSYVEYGAAEPAAEDILKTLADANCFSMEELKENRDGRISNQQMGKLVRKALAPLWAAAMTLAGWLLFVLVIQTFVPGIVLQLAYALGAEKLGVPLVAVTAGCLFSLLVALLKCSRKTVELLLDLSAGKAAYTEGRVYASREDEAGQGMRWLHGEKVPTYFYVIKNDYYEVSAAGHAVLPHGGLFRLYFTPRSHLLLSIEPAVTA